MKKYFYITAAFIVSSLLVPVSIFAHSVVSPSNAGVAQYVNFSLSVPTEKDNPTVSVRLVVPSGVTNVTPNVKAGWKITEKKTGEGEDAVVSEIEWSGGSIPPDQRDQFLFSAKTPSTPSNIVWKTYQTYQNGVVVGWDKEASDNTESDTRGPASQTKIINDLAPAATPVEGLNSSNGNANFLVIISLLISVTTAYKVFIDKK